MQIEGTVRIRNKKTRSIERFHPWVFSGAIKSIDREMEEGAFVKVIDEDDRLLGHGFFSPEASIAVRLTHFGDDQPTTDSWLERLRSAYQLRERLGLTADDQTNCYRLIHGEGDRLPGLIIDHYDGALVIQAHAWGMWRLLDTIKDGLLEIYGDSCKAIYQKSADTLPNGKEEGIENGYLHGEGEASHVVLENGIKMHVDWVLGQKTGFFLDQRENRALVGKLSKGRRVLNTFSYTGGFSLYSLQNDAEYVHSLDASGKALSWGDENVVLNGFDPAKHKSIQADAVQYLKNLEHSYDLIILDPPAFAKHQKARHKAVQGYKRINRLAMEQIEPGGLLFTFSCSQAVDKQLFTNTVIAAAIEAKRKVRILHQLHQPADHPINAFHPEGEYLKGLVLEVK